jgi:hypothetical protein
LQVISWDITFIADIYGEGITDNAEAGQKSSYYKTNYKEYQNEFH